jgi:hypothetical protein
MIWTFSADGNVCLGNDAADLGRSLDVPKRSIVQTCMELLFN